MTIINVAQDIEFIEGQFEFHGISKQRQVCRVGEGLAYINSTGVYFFDGQTVKPLTDGTISTVTIDKDECAVGFDPNRNLLICWVGENSGVGSDINMYYFSFVTQTWVGSTDKYPAASSGSGYLPATNIVAATTDGESIYESTENGQFYNIGTSVNSSAAAFSSGIATLQTGKLHCGNIAQDKKFYKLKINVVEPTDSDLYLDWSVDGSTFTDNSSTHNLTNGYNEIKLTEKNKGKFIILRIRSSALKGNLEIGDISLIYRWRMLR